VIFLKILHLDLSRHFDGGRWGLSLVNLDFIRYSDCGRWCFVIDSPFSRLIHFCSDVVFNRHFGLMLLLLFLSFFVSFFISVCCITTGSAARAAIIVSLAPSMH
jgi:hypothetical protein